MTRWNTTKENPTEFEEQVKLAKYLDMKGYDWFHVPNGGKRDAVTGARMKKQGAKKGVPDNFILNVPQHLDYNGIVIELKRKKGGRLTKEQKDWLIILRSLGWLTKVAYGADDAIDWLENIFEK